MFSWNSLLNKKQIREVSMVTQSKRDRYSPFDKGFDTICNGTILRRLQNKAQIYALEQEDYVQSRLTHSIEVLSIAESLGIKERKKSIKQELGGPNSGMEIRTPEGTLDLIYNIPTILMSVVLMPRIEPHNTS